MSPAHADTNNFFLATKQTLARQKVYLLIDVYARALHKNRIKTHTHIQTEQQAHAIPAIQVYIHIMYAAHNFRAAAAKPRHLGVKLLFNFHKASKKVYIRVGALYARYNYQHGMI